jgi:site-specific recombinase XerD
MKKSNSEQIGPLLQYFFVQFLCMQKRVSPATVASYRDTFRLLLQFIQEKKGIVPAALRIPDLDVAVILSFLDYLRVPTFSWGKSPLRYLAAFLLAAG